MGILDFGQIFSSFAALFIIIDVLGSVPIFLNINAKGEKINAFKAALYSLLIFLFALFVGEGILKVFQVDLSAFAIAGSFVLLILAVEMILDIEIFKTQGPKDSTTLFPVVFPLVAGPASFTTLLTLRSVNDPLNLIIAIVLNLIIVFLVLSNLKWVHKLMGTAGAFIMRKFFGVILLAIAVQTFMSNLQVLIATFYK